MSLKCPAGSRTSKFSIHSTIIIRSSIVANFRPSMRRRQLVVEILGRKVRHSKSESQTRPTLTKTAPEATTKSQGRYGICVEGFPPGLVFQEPSPWLETGKIPSGYAGEAISMLGNGSLATHAALQPVKWEGLAVDVVVQEKFRTLGYFIAEDFCVHECLPDAAFAGARQAESFLACSVEIRDRSINDTAG